MGGCPMDTKEFVSFKKRLTDNCSKVIVGKDEVIEQVVVCLIAAGHILLEDLPGTGKTMLLRSFSKSIGGQFRRIQFTPDLMPSDLTGINFYNPKTGDFEFRPGPLFANLILADEINRATPRSQSALLEVMEEKQISVDGKTYRMEEPYMVMATQNPLESYGTFPLPEAQMDRFFMRLKLGYMTREQEIAVRSRRDAARIIDELEPVVSAEELLECASAGTSRATSWTSSPPRAAAICWSTACPRAAVWPSTAPRRSSPRSTGGITSSPRTSSARPSASCPTASR